MKGSRHGHRGSKQVRAIRRSRDEVIPDVQIPPAESISSGAEIRGCNAVCNDNGFFQPNKVEVVAQHKEWDVHTIGDEAEPEFSTQVKSPLDNVVVAGHRRWAAIANMSKHGKTVIN